MGKERTSLTGEVSREREVDQIRKAARQFALLYFHFSKVLYDQFGLEKAKGIIRQVVFEQAVDRAEQLRQQAKALGNGTDTVEDFRGNIDKELAPFYCDVIDTTTIEHFTGHLSHRITQNVILEGTECKREYFESEKVKRGEYTYGTIE